MQRRFAQVDVFTDRSFFGNALAVVVDGEGLTTDDMQRVANWTNLSETTFLLPPTDPAADYRVRIFTASEELPFAGHPTLGTCHVWLAHGGRPRAGGVIVQECDGPGWMGVLIGGGRFAAPYVVSQGTALGRAGRLYIETDADGAVWVGGDVVTCIAGTIEC